MTGAPPPGSSSGHGKTHSPLAMDVLMPEDLLAALQHARKASGKVWTATIGDNYRPGLVTLRVGSEVQASGIGLQQAISLLMNIKAKPRKKRGA